jgi:hypothetical protein
MQVVFTSAYGNIRRAVFLRSRSKCGTDNNKGRVYAKAQARPLPVLKHSFWIDEVEADAIVVHAFDPC